MTTPRAHGSVGASLLALADGGEASDDGSSGSASVATRATSTIAMIWWNVDFVLPR